MDCVKVKFCQIYIRTSLLSVTLWLWPFDSQYNDCETIPLETDISWTRHQKVSTMVKCPPFFFLNWQAFTRGVGGITTSQKSRGRLQEVVTRSIDWDDHYWSSAPWEYSFQTISIHKSWFRGDNSVAWSVFILHIFVWNLKEEIR